MYSIWTLCVSLNVNHTISLTCSNPTKWFPISFGMQSKLFKPSLLSHLINPHLITLLQQYWLVLFFTDRPDFFCFRDLYLLSPLPRRNLPQISRTHPLTLFRFLPTWNLFEETFLTTLSKKISNLSFVFFSSWLASLARITRYLVYCLSSTWFIISLRTLSYLPLY